MRKLIFFEKTSGRFHPTLKNKFYTDEKEEIMAQDEFYMDDERICKELKAGNKRILDELYAYYHKRIFGFALSYLKSEEDAYDIVQEVFIGLWNNRHSLRKDSRIEPLIFKVTKNAVVSLFRKKTTERKYLEYLGNNVISNNIGAQEMADFGFLEDLYENLISQLPEKRKEIFILSRKNGLNNKDIAERLSISEKTVENQLTKALAFLKENLENAGWLGVMFFHLFIV